MKVRNTARAGAVLIADSTEGAFALSSNHRSLLLAAATLAIAPSPVLGQGEEAAQMRELLAAFTHGEVILGRIPDGSPLAGLLPANARIAGTVSRPGDGGSVTVVASIRGDTDGVTQRVREAVLAAGWRPLDPDPTRGRGFVQTGRFDRSIFCGDEGSVMLNATEGPSGEVRIQLSHMASASRNLCDERRMARPFMTPQLPTLRAPPGATMRGGGSMSSTGDGFATSATFDTTMPIGDVAAHFARQLESQGWQEAANHVDSLLAVRTYTREDAGEGSFHGMLFVIAPAQGSGTEAFFRVAPLAATMRE